MPDRNEQLKEIYGIEFPDDLFSFWEWHQSLEGAPLEAFRDVLGMSLVGPFQVLAGDFDGADLRYPAVLHWRYALDPPEFFTVISGDTDGLHWGYWFDDPGTLPPVVTAYYARDGFELWTSGATLFDAARSRIEASEDGVRENKKYDPEYADEYDRDLERLQELKAVFPNITGLPRKRMVTAGTREGMGVVVPSDSFTDVEPPSMSQSDAIILSQVADLVGRGHAGTALYWGRILWPDRRGLAFTILEQAYEALGRHPLLRVARAHHEHPTLPLVDVLQHRKR